MAHVWLGVMSEGQPFHLASFPRQARTRRVKVRTTEYNDLATFRWLGTAWIRTSIFDQMYVGKWYCVEAHARLNNLRCANVVFEF